MRYTDNHAQEPWGTRSSVSGSHPPGEPTGEKGHQPPTGRQSASLLRLDEKHSRQTQGSALCSAGSWRTRNRFLSASSSESCLQDNTHDENTFYNVSELNIRVSLYHPCFAQGWPYHRGLRHRTAFPRLLWQQNSRFRWLSKQDTLI